MNAATKFTYSAATGYSPTDDIDHTSPVAKPGLFARFSIWLADQPRRRAVLNELRSMSDHELADIGLARADLHRVFDPEFVATFRS